MRDINQLCIQYDTSILSALKQMDVLKGKLLIVLQKGLFLSVLSIGDIQRAIIDNISLDTNVLKILRKDVRVANSSDDMVQVKAHMRKMRNEFMPIVSDKKKLVDVIFWEDLFEKEERKSSVKLNIPVVIMAGGKGSRLKPVTNILPKPLIPIGEKTIVEEIMDCFVNVGCARFLMSVNYKADIIKYYFNTLKNPNYLIDYFQEDIPLGTAGSMFLIKDKIDSTFFVSNCDVIIDQDIEEIYNFHKEKKNVITIVSVLKHYKIPYGTIETGDMGQLLELVEKPELTFQINSGMYILEPELLNEIPHNKFFHITELINNVMNSGRNIGVFPVSEGSWRDIGNWDEYMKMIKNG